jgi:hypothetical protein
MLQKELKKDPASDDWMASKLVLGKALMMAILLVELKVVTSDVVLEILKVCRMVVMMVDWKGILKERLMVPQKDKLWE